MKRPGHDRGRQRAGAGLESLADFREELDRLVGPDAADAQVVGGVEAREDGAFADVRQARADAAVQRLVARVAQPEHLAAHREGHRQAVRLRRKRSPLSKRQRAARDPQRL
ncbi:hypothetical protein AB0D27_38030 [Streptomyces sp. NPDC048415]|uniref:hypothetical protein n=1 Tax=Streptomyces sp. NPDC048415 TaxID=3154822 RepID=UPI0034435A14